jgi:cytochrome c-type biogenesis protein CcmH/NrfG
MTDHLDADRRRQLDEERDFLMRSLDDLELERESGGIDDESYTELHDDYTARAAAVIRTLRDGVDVTPAPAPHSPERTRRRVLLVGGVVVFAVLAGVSLAYALGARLPGQTSSGNSVAAAPSTTNASQKAVSAKIKALQGQVNVKPDDYDLRLQLARAYEENGDLANALKQSDAAISIDPNRPEGHANAARLLYLASSQVPTKNAQAQLVSQALAGFDEAIKVGPDYADAYYFRAVLYAATTQYARSQTDLQYYLSKAPTGEWADQARQLLSQVTTALESPSTTVPPTTTKPPKK